MKPFPASKKKLEKAQKKGDFPKYMVLKSHLAIIMLILSSSIYIAFAWVRLKKLIEYHWLNPAVINPNFQTELIFIALSLVLFVLLAVAASIIFVEIGMKKFQIALKFDLIDFKHFNVVQKVKELFSEFPKQLLQLGLVLVYLSLVVFVFMLYQVELSQLALVLSIVMFVFVVLSSILDFSISRMKYSKKHRMDHNEVRQEHKESEKDPHYNSYFKSLHQEILMHDIREKVKGSKVILVSDF